MSQARGRYSGNRDNRQGPSHQSSKATSLRQNKPFVKAAPIRNPAETASIFKTRSFKLLVDAVGAENIALGLDSNLTRVAELANGERFTPETAFHIETTLGLPDGFFDQPNPVLTSEIIARLRSPLLFIHSGIERENTQEEACKSAPIKKVKYHPASIDHLLKEPEMPKKTSGGSPRAAANSKPTTAAKPAATTRPQSAPAKVKASSKSESQQSLALNDVATVENIRRANLHVLTSRKGSKVRLAEVMEISDSNMANRFYGQKRMDDPEANRFTKRLGLPDGWLDVPRSVTDIPEPVSDLLVPSPRRHTAAQHELPPAVEPATTAARKPASSKLKTAGARHAPTPDADHTSVLTSLAAKSDAGTGQEDQSLSFASEPAIQQPADNGVPFSVVRQQVTPVIAQQTITDPHRLSSATSLDNLQGIEPIAEALIKTLACKARTGRLDEMKALELLQQAVLL
jgi:hypothetical protein